MNAIGGRVSRSLVPSRRLSPPSSILVDRGAPPTTARKAAPKKKTAKRKTTARKRITPAREARGLDANEIAPLVAEIARAGGTALGAYREPLSGRPLLLAVLPRDAVEPTPFQRDLSPTHAKRLAQRIDEAGAFIDPIIVVRGAAGGFWTPNGRHRLAAAKVLGMRQITALVSPDEELAFRILALNTEKAHNVRDRAMEAIRMAGRSSRSPSCVSRIWPSWRQSRARRSSDDGASPTDQIEEEDDERDDEQGMDQATADMQ